MIEESAAVREKRAGRIAMTYDVGVVIGLAFVVFGLWMIYRPLAPLIGGLFVVLICWFLGYRREQA